MKQITLAVSLLLSLASCVSAQQSSSSQETLLTAGVVKRVDLVTNMVVLDSGRKVRPRLILVNDQFMPLSTVQPNDVVFVAGADLGFEETQPSALPGPARRR